MALVRQQSRQNIPFLRGRPRRLLVSRRHTDGRNRTHGLDKLSGRPRARRSCAAFVEPAAILELRREAKLAFNA
jgi:hypothetical protein